MVVAPSSHHFSVVARSQSVSQSVGQLAGVQHRSTEAPSIAVSEWWPTHEELRMGLFKGMKDVAKLSKQATDLQKEQQKAAGYKPGLRGMMSQMGDQIGQATETMADITGQSDQRDRLMAEGLDATGTIIGMGTPARGAQMFNLDIDFEVNVPGRPAYRVANQYMVSAGAQIGLGVTLPLKVDPSDQSKLVILWDQAARAPARGEVRPATDSGYTVPPTAPPASSAGGRDALGELERLASLHAAGALSDSEFEQMKRAILGS